MMTAKQLRATEARYQRASSAAETHRQARNATVREALREGWTHQRIADATGLSRGRISQIREHQRPATPDNSRLTES